MFTGLPGVASVAGPEHESLDATYYDTADLRLARAGGTLCRTEDETWHAAVPGDVDLAVPAARSPDGVPGELVDLVRAYTGGRPLRPCVHVTTHRDRWRLIGRSGGTLAEIADDSVHARVAGAQDRSATWHEVSIDRAAGEVDRQLDATMRERLAVAGVQPADSGGAYVLTKTLGDRIPRPTSIGAGPKSTAGEAVTAYLRTQVAKVREGDVAVHVGTDTAVHDMRVAVRRLRSTLRTFGKVVGRKRATAVGTELAWLSDVLGEARDAEVLGRTLVAEVDRTPVDLVLGPVKAEIARRLERGAADAHAALLAALAGERYVNLLDALDGLVSDPNTHRTATRPARTVLPALVGKAERRVHKRVRTADRAAPGPAADAALHDVRKAAKRLRYAAELAAPVVGAPAERTERRAKRVQRLLGDHHDLVVLRTTLRDIGVQVHLAGSNAFTFGLLHGRAGEHAGRAEQDFHRAWRKLTTKKARRWLR